MSKVKGLEEDVPAGIRRFLWTKRLSSIVGDIQTNPCLAYLLTKRLGDLSGLIVLEPASGLGAFANAIKVLGGNCLTIDVKPQYPADITADFTKWDSAGKTFDLIIGNPPYGRLPTGEKAEWVFFQKSLGLLRPEGRVGFILSAWFLLNSSHRFRWVYDHCRVVDLAMVDRKWFPGVRMNFIWLVVKNKTELDHCNWPHLVPYMDFGGGKTSDA